MKLVHYLLFFTSLIFIFSCSKREQKTNGNKYVEYSCNVEKIDAKKNKFCEDSLKNIFFQNTDTQSEDFSFSGKYSVKLFPGSPYALTTELKNVAPDDYLGITVWRKTPNNNGVIVIDGGDGFYYAGKNIIEKDENGWDKIFVEYHVPPNFFNKRVKIFVWSNSNDTVYFDNLRIVHRDKKIYPDYKNVRGLQIHTDQVNLFNLNKKRIRAFETGVLVNSDEDYSKIVLYDGQDFLNGTFRLKGDLVDHLQGEKWSYRIKLKKEFAWRNMRTFSIQNPSTRYFLAEWLAHKIFKHENVLTTRYGFIPVKINNQSLGIYAWEEHFEKQLIESNNRREGPIIRFDESLFWQRVLETKVTGREWDIDYFGAAKITPFKANRTVSDTALYKQFTEAQNLLFQYKNRVKPVSEIFDVNKLARYYALVDITQAYHGFAWHNQRFYYNPVTCLLEPIAFDGYIENGVFKRIDEQVNGLLNADKIYNYSREELLLFHAFADSVFNEKYIHYLQEYSTPEFVDEIISEYQQNADSLSALITDEFPYYRFNFSLLKKQTEFVRNNINKIESNILEIRTAINAVQQKDFGREYTTDVNKNLIPFQVQAFFDKSKQQLEILNFSNTTIKVLGVFMVDQLPVSFDSKFEIKPYKGTNPQRISVEQTGSPLKVLFSVNNEMFETEVSHWPAPGNSSKRQEMLENFNISGLPVVGNTIYFNGQYSFSTDVVIPATMNVVFEPGTEIDLVNGAGFFSFAPVEMIGTENDSIEITSSDKSANGFNIIQPKGLSQLKFVRFSGISNLRKGGWQTPAAIALYEADVIFENCTFEANFNCDDALNIVRSNFSVTNCRFENTFADAFDSDFCTGKVTNCIFENIGNDAIDFSGSNVEIADCRMINISDKAISGGENSTLFVSECEIERANIGVAAKDLSTVKLDKITITNTVYGFVAFVKKPEYGVARIEIDNLKMKKTKVFHQIEEGSVFVLNGKTIFGKEKKLAVKLYQ